MADISALTVKVRLRGMGWLKLGKPIVRLRFLPRSWRLSFANFCMHRLSIQVGCGKKTPLRSLYRDLV